ncbi:MAG: SGNH/GDSL hydrolase family protein [Alistipes sp.]|jgi:lysophospholipase L1-like esterase|nr:SGNH/GDSL hydrolase family protein [Alistipes sp.]
MKRTILLLAVALVCALSPARGQSVAPFRDGDRAVFLGNSITDGGHFHSYIWLYYMTRFPEMNLRVVNAGIGGDTAENMYNRLDTDVFNHKPTVLTMTFGMNDTGYAEYNRDGAAEFGERKYGETCDNYTKVEERLKSLPAGVRIVQMGTSPYDETSGIENKALRGKNAVMQRVVEFQRQSAERNGWEFLDLNAPMVEINRREQTKDPMFAIAGSDRIHPGNDGHMVMAYLYLKAQGFAGKEVADVEIDAARASVTKAVNANVTNVRRAGRDISFDYLAASLPYPLDTLSRSRGTGPQSDIVNLVPFVDEMNREMLTVKGLRGNYELSIDGERIGVWSGAEFAAGINLAVETWTPQYRQAQSVMHLNEYRWEIERTFRELAWIEYNFFRPRGMLGAFDRNSVAEIDKHLEDGWIRMHKNRYATYLNDAVREARAREMEMLIEQIYEINKPVTRSISLHKVD